ncbi:MAG: chromosome segregation protein SMC [Gammaproteobacteria bacterium]
MRLKSIKLVGFKSFVDPTTTTFPDNLTAIVGPNGCGKSNIIDAARWVMGEASAKYLRGESMADVIFSGSSARKPVAQASVELVFDNSEGKVGGEYAKYAEISVKRQVTRDGQSSYYLNGTKCRRKDITDIFLGTGLGPRSYAIIEQGMISRLIEAKPEELRIYIEEAAGISRYKERRKETESRMRRTRENLERLTDLREELERQIAHLQRQAATAERYKQFREEERTLRAQLHALRWQHIDADVGVREAAIRELEVKLEAQIAEQRRAEAEIEKYREANHELIEAFNEVQGRFYGIGADIARVEQRIEGLRQQQAQYSAELDQAERNRREAAEHLEQDRAQIEEIATQLLELEPEHERHRMSDEAAAEALAVAEDRMHQWQIAWDTFNQVASQPRQRAEVEQSRIQHLEKSIRMLDDRIERLEQEKKTLSSGPLAQEVENLLRQVAEMQARIDQQQAQADEIGVVITRQREENNRTSSELDARRGEMQALKGRHASLEALQQAAQSDVQGGITAWLRERRLDGRKRLAESLDVDSGWEKAVETVLGDTLQAVCVDGLDPLAGVLGGVQHGHLMLIENRAMTVTGGDRFARLSDRVRASGGVDVQGLLAGVYTADSLPDALARRAQLGAGESLVTRDGIWIGANWLRVTGEKDAAGGLLMRRQELEELDARIEESEAVIAELAERLAAGRELLREREQAREQAQREMSAVSREYSNLSAEVSARQVRLEQFTARHERIERELTETRRQQSEEREQITLSRNLLQEALDAMEGSSKEREDLLRRRDEQRAQLDDMRQRARHDRDAAHRVEMEIQNLKTRQASMQQGLDRWAMQLRQMDERRDFLAAQLSGGDDPVVEAKEQLEELLSRRAAVEEELRAARQRSEAVDHDLREMEQQRSRFEQGAYTVRTNLESQRMEWQALQVQRATVIERLKEAEITLEDVLASMPAEANIPQWEQRADEIAQRIIRLGPINLAAIDEYAAQSERKNYLDAQNADLEDALSTLENAIKKIDKETRARFEETFNKVNKGLQDLFPRVFGGGHAYLELTSQDLLETGVAIMARPPGKKNSTIHLLSGGEKALTALSLVFSIFQLNPAPFCMLDEVDAPLDDANVGRYANLVRSMSDKVQFIYITHNKIAMEMASSLMGVTMHEPGVSRLVAVDVDEAAELAAV